jgi:hypothetical protein
VAAEPAVHGHAQVARTVAYSLGSALSATVLVLYIPRGRALPSDSGYTAAAVVSVVILLAALAASVLFAMSRAGDKSAQAKQEVMT